MRTGGACVKCGARLGWTTASSRCADCARASTWHLLWHVCVREASPRRTHSDSSAMATLGQRLMLEARKAAASKESSATKLFDEAADGTAAGPSSSTLGGSSIEFKRIPRATVMSKLVLRSGASMRSQRLRDITAGASVLIVDSVESAIASQEVREMSTEEIGHLVIEQLRNLDQV